MAPGSCNASTSATRTALNGPGVCGTRTPPGASTRAAAATARACRCWSSRPTPKRNFVDHTLTDQTSILRFIEDNWLSRQRIGDGSFDAIAGALDGMFDWHHPAMQRLLLDPATGAPVRDGEQHG